MIEFSNKHELVSLSLQVFKEMILHPHLLCKLCLNREIKLTCLVKINTIDYLARIFPFIWLKLMNSRFRSETP